MGEILVETMLEVMKDHWLSNLVMGLVLFAMMTRQINESGTWPEERITDKYLRQLRIVAISSGLLLSFGLYGCVFFYN